MGGGGDNSVGCDSNAGRTTCQSSNEVVSESMEESWSTSITPVKIKKRRAASIRKTLMIKLPMVASTQSCGAGL